MSKMTIVILNCYFLIFENLHFAPSCSCNLESPVKGKMMLKSSNVCMTTNGLLPKHKSHIARGGARGGLEGAIAPPSEHASPPSEGKKQFFRRFLAATVP